MNGPPRTPRPRPLPCRPPRPPAGVRLLLLALGFALPLVAPRAADDAPTYEARRVDSPPRIDGDLSDPVWEEAAPAFRLWQQEPDPGKEATEITEVRVLRDRDNLYFGILCRDREPGKVKASTKAREGELWTDDHIRILLDTFLDRRNAYVFEINPAGAIRDGLAKGDYSDYSWDGIWEGRARRTAEGWSIEIAVPTRTITFKPGLNTWGFNVERQIIRKHETDRWASPRRDANFSTPALAGLLTGLDGLDQGKGLSIRPYAALHGTRDLAAGTPRDNRFDAGFDVYKSLTGNLNAVFTYNTDFAETEVDSRQINITRFPLFLPEKRSFFLEGATIFDFGVGLGSSFIPFFSRRVGLVSGEQVPILAGGKLWGRLGNTNLGVLDVGTKAVDDLGLPRRNLFVARVKQNVLDESYVGAIVTDGDPEGANPNSLFGVDFVYQTSRFRGDKNFIAGGWAVYSRNPSGRDRPYGWGFQVDYPNDRIDTSLTYKVFGEGLDPALGFLPRPGIRNLTYNFEYKPRPQRWGIRRLNFEAYANLVWQTEGRLESRSLWLSPLSVTLDSGDYFEAGYNSYYEYLEEPFEIAENVVIPAGVYRYDRASGGFSTGSQRWWQLSAWAVLGTFYNGRLNQYEGSFGFHPNAALNTSLGFEYVEGRLATGDFIQRLLQWKLAYAWSPDLNLNLYLQYDNVSQNVGVNARLRWTVKPGTDLFVVWNHGWNNLPSPGNPGDRYFVPAYDQVAVKFQYTWRP